MSDVTPVPLTAGPIILYRHFKRMSEHEVLVVSGEIPESDPPDRHWRVVRLPRRLRWLTRSSTRPLFEELRAREIERETRKLIDDFDPSLVVSVWAGEYLLAADRIARRRGLPLALICHDDFQRMLPSLGYVQLWAHRRLSRIYRRATTRICISDGMQEAFRRRYGAPGVVVHPITDEPGRRPRSTRRMMGDGRLQIGFFGNAGGGNLDVLLTLSDVLAEVGGQLHVSGAGGRSARSRLTEHPAVVDCGFFSTTDDMRSYFSGNVDAMVVPQSFKPHDRPFVEVSFPSKLVEAATLTLPLIIAAPAYASAARWARQHCNAVLLIESSKPSEFTAACDRLAKPLTREHLSTELYRFAKKDFDPGNVHGQFERALFDVAANADRPGAAGPLPAVVLA